MVEYCAKHRSNTQIAVFALQSCARRTCKCILNGGTVKSLTAKLPSNFAAKVQRSHEKRRQQGDSEWLIVMTIHLPTRTDISPLDLR